MSVKLKNLEHRFYKEVASGSAESSDYTIPDDTIVTIYEVGASGNQSGIVSIVFDPGGGSEQAIIATSSESSQGSDQSFSGNGKKIRITLTNNDTISRYMGGYVLLGEKK